MVRVAVINLGFGNLYGLNQALITAGFESEIYENPNIPDDVQAIVLPGVGSFGNAIQKLEESGWKDKLEDWIEGERPLLGICLGMQLLFKKSYEFGEHEGFGVFNGNVIKIHHSEGERTPKMGWFYLHPLRKQHPEPMISVGLDPEQRVYFVHSFGAQINEECNVIATVKYYGQDYVAVIKKGSVWATQFHPENSHDNGVNFLKSFLSFVKSS